MSSSLELLHEYIKSESLRKHCYAVEACMKYYAIQLNEDENKWGDAGLLHDLDWEMYPETHPNTAVPILEQNGYDKQTIDAILGHAYPDRTNTPRETPLAKYLFACDEITGFITAYSLMKPDGMNTVEAKSITKKMKDKHFARNVNRDDIKLGADEIGVPLEEHITNVIGVLKSDSRLN